jgi:cytochrome c-type biogenesis protein CcmH/NrfF
VNKIVELTEKLKSLACKANSHYNAEIATSIASRIVSDFLYEVNKGYATPQEIAQFHDAYRPFISHAYDESDFE